MKLRTRSFYMLSLGWLILPVIILLAQPWKAVVQASPLAPDGYSHYEFLPDDQYTQKDERATLKIDADISGLPEITVYWFDPQNESVSCSLQGGQCGTTYQYSNNGLILSATTDFLIAGQQRAAGTYRAVITHCVFELAGTCINWSQLLEASFSITGDTSHRLVLPLVMR